MFELRGVAKHFITVSTGNCNFVFRKPSINVSLGFVLRRIEGPGQTKVTILLGASQGPDTWCNIAGIINPNSCIEHFRVTGTLCLSFKTSLCAKPFIWKWVNWFIWKWTCRCNTFSYVSYWFHSKTYVDKGIRQLGNGLSHHVLNPWDNCAKNSMQE